ncbi:MAG TPA: hypothetical protein PLT45_04850 [Smithella sp.]|nr:hypothetical protein [Smithella sp.]
MNRSMKMLLLIIGFLVVWGTLAAADAGILGLGVIFSMAALVAPVSQKFEAHQKTAGIAVILASLIIALVGIVLKKTMPAAPSLEMPLGTVSLVLVAVYFFIGRKRRFAPS